MTCCFPQGLLENIIFYFIYHLSHFSPQFPDVKYIFHNIPHFSAISHVNAYKQVECFPLLDCGMLALRCITEVVTHSSDVLSRASSHVMHVALDWVYLQLQHTIVALAYKLSLQFYSLL